MPLFELDEERVRLVQPMQPVGGTFVDEVGRLLGRHLATVVGEPLFVVSGRVDAEPGGRPQVLGLDRHGRRVVVEVMHRLDQGALARALRHAGEAAGMTSSDLAREYGGGPAEFAADLRAFREGLPFGAAAAPELGPARLVVLCAKVARDAEDAVRFLRSCSDHVAVLQVGVVRGADGRRWFDIGAVATHERDRRAIEPSGERVHAARAEATPPAGMQHATPPVPVPVRAPIQPLADVRADPGLVGLAAGRAVDLVWERRRRGQTVVARLRADGVVELPDGRAFTDPSAAATAAVDAEHQVDGWRLWRVGTADGPPLAEAAGQPQPYAATQRSSSA